MVFIEKRSNKNRRCIMATSSITRNFTISDKKIFKELSKFEENSNRKEVPIKKEQTKEYGITVLKQFKFR